MDLIERFGMVPHVEGGSYKLLDEGGEATRDSRHSHGVIYYALGPGEHADFHAIDCDEYWLWHAGPTLEIWSWAPDGRRSVRLLGLTEGAEPCVLVRAGDLFGARPVPGSDGTTLLSCVTVPQFTYDNYRLLRRDEMLAEHPDAADFFA